jgi:hypothetical protein
MVRFEEFRHALGRSSAKPTSNAAARPHPRFQELQGLDLARAPHPGPRPLCHRARRQSPVSPAVFSELTRLLLNSNTNRMPPAFEHGLIEFFSTFEVNGIHITVGAPPPQPDLDWARIHLLVTNPEYFGRCAVLLYNLRKGVDEDPAYRNAFGNPPPKSSAGRRHFAAGNFQPAPFPALPMAPSDFHERPISDTDMRLARADLLAGEQSAAEYRRPAATPT